MGRKYYANGVNQKNMKAREKFIGVKQVVLMRSCEELDNNIQVAWLTMSKGQECVSQATVWSNIEVKRKLLINSKY